MLNKTNFYQDNFYKVSKINISQATMEKVAAHTRGQDFNTIVVAMMESPAKAQFIALASLYCVAVENCQQPRDLDPADGIIARLGESVKRYGEKAFQLSEAQVKLAVGKLIGKI